MSLSLLVATAISAPAQRPGGRIELRVQIRDDRDSHSGARVQLTRRQAAELVAYTNPSGSADFRGLRPGIYTLSVSVLEKEV